MRDLDFGQFPGNEFGEYHPRGLVFGPDEMLYVSVVGNLDPDQPNLDRLTGFILRFQEGKFLDVFASNDSKSCPFLHRPDGLVFGPDGKLYVASFRADPTDTDKIVVLEADGSCPSNIVLDTVGGDRAYAQGLLFGPGGGLYVPITSTGEVRRYNVRNKQYDSLVPAGSPLGAPQYLTFGKTDPSTLAYRP